MLVPRETGDLGAAAGARLWNVTGGPGNKSGLDGLVNAGDNDASL